MHFKSPKGEKFKAKKNLTEGIVSWISRRTCRILAEGRSFDCIVKTNLEAGSSETTIVVGDKVLFSPSGTSSGRVESVLPRKTQFRRFDPHDKRRPRLLAANIDQVLVVVSFSEPPLHPRFIDRCLLAAVQGGTELLVVVNKADLPGTEERARSEKSLAAYSDLTSGMFFLSALTGEGLDALKERLAGKTTLFMGQSGVGKSSLVNQLAGSAGAKTGEINAKSGKGSHTTSDSRLYELDPSTRIIDSPGVREFDLGLLDLGELAAAFPDFVPYIEGCAHGDCRHAREENCGVKRAVAEGKISRARYQSWMRLLGEEPGEAPSAGTGGFFECVRCRTPVPLAAAGTEHRNHCPRCLWSLHVDHLPGDRSSCCGGAMEPISVWVKSKEWVIIHRCVECGTLHGNRVAGDDNEALLLSLAVKPLANPPFSLVARERAAASPGAG